MAVKLPASLIDTFCAMRKLGFKNREIAAKFKLPLSTVSSAVARRARPPCQKAPKVRAQPTRGKGRPPADRIVVTLELAEAILERHHAQISQAAIARAIGCSQSTVARVIQRARDGHEFPALPAKPYGAEPESHETHLRLIHVANGYGFAWWPERIMTRVYALERAPTDRSWWKAA